MPRTESPKKRSVRSCGDCGQELVLDNDGTCPKCRRFEQLRLAFIVPRPSDLTTTHRPGSQDVKVSGGEMPPTVAEYRAILAERRQRSASLAQHDAMVIRTHALRQSQVSSRPQGANAPGDGAPAAPTAPEPLGKDLSAHPPMKAKARGGEGKSRRAARARVRSSRKLKATTPSAAASSSDPVQSRGVRAAPSSSMPPKAIGALSDTAPPTGTDPLALPRQVAHPLMGAGPVRHRALGSRTVVPFVINVAIVVTSVLIGVAVSILLSSL